MVKTEDTTASKRDHAGQRMRRRTENAPAADNAGEKSVFTRGGRRRTMRRRQREIADREASALCKREKGKGKRVLGLGAALRRKETIKKGSVGQGFDFGPSNDYVVLSVNTLQQNGPLD
ncbi:unnamed protein product [Linum trigynum]|uniref:Uncharacterized protein n=1 Tax=Linum trigynum TaxID=586398 RepID=A0AAV2DQH1_9ROSI